MLLTRRADIYLLGALGSFLALPPALFSATALGILCDLVVVVVCNQLDNLISA